MIRTESFELPRAAGETAQIDSRRAVLMKADLIEDVSSATAITQAEANTILDVILNSMVRALRRHDKVELRGFGSFQTRQRQARTGRNPKTGEAVKVPAKRVAFFKPSKELKQLIQGA